MTAIRRVAFVGQPEYFQVCYETDLDDLYDVRAYPLTFNSSGQMDVERLDDLVSFKPDITVFFRGEHVPNDFLSRLSGITIGYSTEPFPKFLYNKLEYTKDSLNRFKFFMNFASKNFDYVFHYDDISRSFMETMGVRISGYRMIPVATNVWTPPKAPVKKSWDIVFFGRTTERRENYMGPLKRDTRFLHVVHGIPGKEAIPYYHGSIIGLNLHCEAETSLEPRVHQMMACGTLVVSDPLSPNSVLEPNKHFVEVNSQYEAYQTCRKILENPAAYENIRMAGQKAVKEQLATRVVLPKLFEDCLAGRCPKSAYDLGRLNLAPMEICAEYNGFEHLLDQIRVAHA